MRFEDLTIDVQMKVFNEIKESLISVECRPHLTVHDVYAKLCEIELECEFTPSGDWISVECLYPIETLPCTSLGKAVEEIQKEYDWIGCETFADLVRFCEREGLLFTELGRLWI